VRACDILRAKVPHSTTEHRARRLQNPQLRGNLLAFVRHRTAEMQEKGGDNHPKGKQKKSRAFHFNWKAFFPHRNLAYPF
jgi:hypothetical protein